MVGAVTTTPHDALFKAAFSKLRHARACSVRWCRHLSGGGSLGRP
jgi:hypothetical protein